MTLGPLARHRANPGVSTAPHLTPEQFHHMLQHAVEVAAAPQQSAVQSSTYLGEEPLVAAEQSAAAPADGQAMVTTSLSPSTPPSEAIQSSPWEVVGSCSAARSGGELAARAGVCESPQCGGGRCAWDPPPCSSGEVNGAENGGGGSCQGSVVLLDTRNIYETRIGRFDVVRQRGG